MGFNAAILGIAAVLVGGCQQGGRVEVSGTPADVRFTVLDTDARSSMCADSLSVTPVTPEEAAPVWRVIAVDPDKCAREVRYGVVTENFAEEIRAIPLRPGVSYRVRASGAGFTAVRDFTVTKDGVSQEAL